MINFERNCRYCKYYGLPVIKWTNNSCEDCFSNFELKEVNNNGD